MRIKSRTPKRRSLDVKSTPLTAEVALSFKFAILCVAAFLVLLKAGEAGAAFEGIVADSRAAGMGDCWSASEIGSVFLVSLPAPKPDPDGRFTLLSASYCAPYGMSELAQRSIALNVPLPGGLLSLGLFERGGALSRERIVSASISRELVPVITASLSVNVCQFAVQGAGGVSCAGLSFGARTVPFTNVEACFSAGNIASTSLGAANSNEGILPGTLLVGFLVAPAKPVTVAAEVRSSPGSLASFHVGTELTPQNGVKFRCGLRTEPVELAAGLAMEFGRVFVETAFFFHPVLGRADALTVRFGSERRRIGSNL